MTFEPTATPEQINARQHAFDNQPDPATLVSREEIRAALLDRHTAATQDKLDAAHVAICGCGGLGSTIAVALTRIGVGHLHLIDFDRVDMTNLNRQQYFLKDSASTRRRRCAAICAKSTRSRTSPSTPSR